jgi:hypothetical protein
MVQAKGLKEEVVSLSVVVGCSLGCSLVCSLVSAKIFKLKGE